MKARLTVEGKARLALATIAEPFEITHAAVGDLTTEQYADEDLYDGGETELHDEKMRVVINAAYIRPDDQFTACFDAIFSPKAANPPIDGGWYAREIGLFFGDGALAAIVKWPETYMPDDEFEDITQGLHATVEVPISDEAAIAVTVSPSQALASKDYVDQRFDVLAAERATADATIECTMNELPAVIAVLPKNLNGHQIIIMVSGSGTLEENMYIRGFHGGTLVIDGNDGGLTLGNHHIIVGRNDAHIVVQDIVLHMAGSGAVYFQRGGRVEWSNFKNSVYGSPAFSSVATVESGADVVFVGATDIDGIASADNIVVHGGGRCRIFGAYDHGVDAKSALRLYAGAIAESLSASIAGDKLDLTDGATYKGKFSRNPYDGLLVTPGNGVCTPRAGETLYVFEVGGETSIAALTVVATDSGYLYYHIVSGSLSITTSMVLRRANDDEYPALFMIQPNDSSSGSVTIHDYQ